MTKERIALFAGTFDPPTLGHLDIIQRAASLCDKLYVGIANNSAKTDCFLTIEERVRVLKAVTKYMSAIEIVSFDILVVDWARRHGVTFLVRGLRNSNDTPYEFAMADANAKIGGLDTVFLMSDPQFSHVSSSLIREISSYGHTLSDFVPAEVEEAISSREQGEG